MGLSQPSGYKHIKFDLNQIVDKTINQLPQRPFTEGMARLRVGLGAAALALVATLALVHLYAQVYFQLLTLCFPCASPPPPGLPAPRQRAANGKLGSGRLFEAASVGK